MDTTLSFFIHDHLGPAWFGALRAVSAVGQGWVILLIVVVLSLIFTLMGRFQKAHMIVLAAVVAALTSVALKLLIGRPRPLLWEPMDAVNGDSFPSGHALITVAVYGLISYFLAERFPSRRWIIYGICGFLMFFIGLSRVYLGVHWPSDVLAGWVVGGAVLALMIWWYGRGGIYRTIRLGIGFVVLALGIVGLILPIIPGIPLVIAALILIFSNKSFSEMFGKKVRPPIGPKDIEIPNE